jgi:imidazolonepropionase-like amidohydrolase
MTDHPVIPIQYLAVNAAIACRAGLPEDLALAAITSVAARLSGIGQTHGTLEPGKKADLALFSSHPFDYRTQTLRVWINGQMVYHRRNNDFKRCIWRYSASGPSWAPCPASGHNVC